MTQSASRHSGSLLHWNCRSVNTQAEELARLISAHRPLVLSLNETRLRADEVLDLQNYVSFESSVPLQSNRRAGVGLYVHDSLSAKEIPASGHPAPDPLVPGHLVTVEIELPGTGPLRISSLYIPPTTSTYSSPALALHLLGIIPREATIPHVILGDLNAHLGLVAEEPDKRGEEVLGWMVEEGFTALFPPPGSFSWTDGTRTTLVDHALASHHHLLADLDASFLPKLVSDHLPLIVRGLVQQPVATQQLQHLRCPGYRLPATPTNLQLARFSRGLLLLENWFLTMPTVISTQEQMDELFNSFSDRLTQLLKDVFPAPTSTTPRRNPKNLAWSLPVASAIKLQKKAYSIWRTALDLVTKKAAFDVFKEARVIAKQMVREEKKQQLQEETRTLLASRAPLSRLLRIGTTRQPSATPDPDAFSSFLKEIMSPAETSSTSSSSSPSTSLLPYLTEDKVQDLLRRLPRRKAADLHGLTNEVLTLGGETMAALLSRFFVLVSTSGQVPSRWMEAKVVPIPKTKSSSTKPADFRPISVLPAIRRVFEKAILPALQPSINQTLHPHQFGFREGCSTLDAILIASDSVACSKGMTHLILLDVNKAFDTVDHQVLLQKTTTALLENHPGLTQHLAHLLPTSVTVISAGSRQQQPSWTTTRGTPQGSHLSPTLYNNYVQQLTTTINTTTPTLLFADDQLLLSESTTTLQRALVQCQEEMEKLGTTYNAKKSVALTGKPNHHATASRSIAAPHWHFSELTPGDAVLGDTIIPLAKTALYLGAPFTAGVGLDRKALAAKNALSSQRACSVLYHLKSVGVTSPTHLRLAYLTYVRPCFFYAAEVAGWTSGQLHLLQVVENKALRLVLSAPRSTSTIAMAYLLRIPPVADQVAYLTRKLASRISLLSADHPTKASCLRSRAKLAGFGRSLLLLNNTPPAVKPSTSPEYWRRICEEADSNAARALVEIIPPNSAHYKLVLSIAGAPGKALRLWLLHRTRHHANLISDNPPVVEMPQELWQFTCDILRSFQPSAVINKGGSVRGQGYNLDPVSYIIQQVIANSPRKKDHLSDIGRVIARWLSMTEDEEVPLQQSAAATVAADDPNSVSL